MNLSMGFLQKLKTSDFTEREKLLQNYFQEEISQALRVKAHQIDIHQPLNTMEIDSMRAFGLRKRLQVDLAVDVPLAQFIEKITIFELASQISYQLCQQEQTSYCNTENTEDNQRIVTEI